MDQAPGRAGTLQGIGFTSAALLPFTLWVVARSLSADLWYDEVWSLQHYSLQSLHRVVTDYTHPNNHVFYNLVQHVWLHAVGIEDLGQALVAPAWVRLPSLLFALGCVLCVGRIARAWFGPAAGWLAPTVLVTSMPFFHFAVQARGYALATLLMAWLVLLVQRAANARHRVDALAIPTATALALYTLPSNLYWVVALAALQLARWAALRRADSDRAGDARRVATLLALGTSVGVLMYAPMLEQMFELRGTISSGQSSLVLLPAVLIALVSGHWLLVALLAPGLAVAARRSRIGVAWLLCLLVAPFVVAAISGDQPFARVYVVLSPIAAALLAAGAAALLQTRATTQLARVGAVTLLLALCQGQFAWQMNAIDTRSRDALATGATTQRLDHAYFGAFFHPRALAQRLRSEGVSQCVLRDGDLVALRAYLGAHDIAALDLSDLRALVLQHGNARVITAHPTSALAAIRSLLPGARIDVETTETYHRVLTVRLP